MTSSGSIPVSLTPESAPTWGPLASPDALAAMRLPPGSARDADGRLNYIVRKVDGSLWRGTQVTPGGTSWREARADTGLL